MSSGKTSTLICSQEVEASFQPLTNRTGIFNTFMSRREVVNQIIPPSREYLLQMAVAMRAYLEAFCQNSSLSEFVEHLSLCCCAAFKSPLILAFVYDVDTGDLVTYFPSENLSWTDVLDALFDAKKAAEMEALLGQREPALEVLRISGRHGFLGTLFRSLSDAEWRTFELAQPHDEPRRLRQSMPTLSPTRIPKNVRYHHRDTLWSRPLSHQEKYYSYNVPTLLTSEEESQWEAGFSSGNGASQQILSDAFEEDQKSSQMKRKITTFPSAQMSQALHALTTQFDATLDPASLSTDPPQNYTTPSRDKSLDDNSPKTTDTSPVQIKSDRFRREKKQGILNAYSLKEDIGVLPSRLLNGVPKAGTPEEQHMGRKIAENIAMSSNSKTFKGIDNKSEVNTQCVYETLSSASSQQYANRTPEQFDKTRSGRRQNRISSKRSDSQHADECLSNFLIRKLNSLLRRAQNLTRKTHKKTTTQPVWEDTASVVPPEKSAANVFTDALASHHAKPGNVFWDSAKCFSEYQSTFPLYQNAQIDKEHRAKQLFWDAERTIPASSEQETPSQRAPRSQQSYAIKRPLYKAEDNSPSSDDNRRNVSFCRDNTFGAALSTKEQNRSVLGSNRPMSNNWRTSGNSGAEASSLPIFPCSTQQELPSLAEPRTASTLSNVSPLQALGLVDSAGHFRRLSTIFNVLYGGFVPTLSPRTQHSSQFNQEPKTFLDNSESCRVSLAFFHTPPPASADQRLRGMPPDATLSAASSTLQSTSKRGDEFSRRVSSAAPFLPQTDLYRSEQFSADPRFSSWNPRRNSAVNRIEFWLKESFNARLGINRSRSNSAPPLHRSCSSTDETLNLNVSGRHLYHRSDSCDGSKLYSQMSHGIRRNTLDSSTQRLKPPETSSFSPFSYKKQTLRNLKIDHNPLNYTVRVTAASSSLRGDTSSSRTHSVTTTSSLEPSNNTSGASTGISKRESVMTSTESSTGRFPVSFFRARRWSDITACAFREADDTGQYKAYGDESKSRHAQRLASPSLSALRQKGADDFSSSDDEASHKSSHHQVIQGKAVPFINGSGMNSRQWSVSGCDVRSDIPSPVRRASFDSLSTQFPWSQFHATIKNQNSHYDNIAIHNTERHRSLKSMRRSSTFNGSRVASDSVLWNPCYLKRRASNLARSKMETFGSKTKTKNSSRSRRSLQLALKHLSGKDQQHNKTLTPLRDLPSSIPVLCRPLFNVQGLKIKVPIGLLCVFAPTNVNETNSEPEQQRKLLSHVANQTQGLLRQVTELDKMRREETKQSIILRFHREARKDAKDAQRTIVRLLDLVKDVMNAAEVALFVTDYTSKDFICCAGNPRCRGLRLSATDPLLGPCFRSKRIYRVASPSTTHVPKLLPLSAKSVFLKKSSFFGEVHNETKLPNAVSGTASKGVSGSTVLKPTAVQSSHENSKETPDIRPVSGTPQNSATPWFPTTQTTFSGSLLNENDKINKKDDLSLQQQSLTELLNAESINLNYDSVAQDIVTRSCLCVPLMNAEGVVIAILEVINQLPRNYRKTASKDQYNAMQKPTLAPLSPEIFSSKTTEVAELKGTPFFAPQEAPNYSSASKSSTPLPYRRTPEPRDTSSTPSKSNESLHQLPPHYTPQQGRRHTFCHNDEGICDPYRPQPCAESIAKGAVSRAAATAAGLLSYETEKKTPPGVDNSSGSCSEHKLRFRMRNRLADLDHVIAFSKEDASLLKALAGEVTSVYGGSLACFCMEMILTAQQPLVPPRLSLINTSKMHRRESLTPKRFLQTQKSTRNSIIAPYRLLQKRRWKKTFFDAEHLLKKEPRYYGFSKPSFNNVPNDRRLDSPHLTYALTSTSWISPLTPRRRSKTQDTATFYREPSLVLLSPNNLNLKQRRVTFGCLSDFDKIRFWDSGSNKELLSYMYSIQNNSVPLDGLAPPSCVASNPVLASRLPVGNDARAEAEHPPLENTRSSAEWTLEEPETSLLKTKPAIDRETQGQQHLEDQSTCGFVSRANKASSQKSRIRKTWVFPYRKNNNFRKQCHKVHCRRPYCNIALNVAGLSDEHFYTARCKAVVVSNGMSSPTLLRCPLDKKRRKLRHPKKTVRLVRWVPSLSLRQKGLPSLVTEKKKWGIYWWGYPLDELERFSLDALDNAVGIDKLHLQHSERLGSFFRAIAGSYHNTNPYHNFFHGIQVYHVTWLLLARYGMSCYITHVEAFGTLLAALCHDVDHPGLNNDFFVAIHHPAALLYNDNAVLENHHCAFTFRLLDCYPALDFREGMDDTDRRTFRRTFIRSVLATDMQSHSRRLATFSNRVQRHGLGSEPFSIASTEDRNFVVEMVLHAADISNPMVPCPYFKQWASLIVEEFNLQCDREAAAGLEITAFMNCRTERARVECQIGFVELIVLPTWRSMALLGPGLKSVVEQGEANARYWHKCAKILAQRAARKKDAEEPSISQFTFLLKSFQSQLPAPFAKIPGLSLDALESCPTPLIEASKHEANSSLSKRASIVPLDDDQYYIRP